MSPHVPRLALLGALLLALVACGAGGAEDPGTAGGTTAATGADHGEIEGAVELAEPALGLTSVDDAGVVRHLDLLEESERQIADVGPASGLHTDGRYLFTQVDGGVAVVDSGVWTWDHVDHFHYYRAEPRHVGLVEGEGPATLATTNSSTTGGTGVFFAGSGEAVRLDTEALSDAELVEQFRVQGEPHAGLAVPIGEHTLVTETGP